MREGFYARMEVFWSSMDMKLTNCVFLPGQPCDGPMGISVALSPATTTVTMSKSMITNASFRTKKLPGKEGVFIITINYTDAIIQ